MSNRPRKPLVTKGRWAKPWDRFASKFVAEDAAACWRWIGKKHHSGYGIFYIDGKHIQPHRFAYEQLFGLIPDGLVIDHLCRNPLCVNPYHMEPVTIGENALRGFNACANHARKTHCPRGHAYDIFTSRERRCRTCDNAAHNRYYHQKREALRG